MSNHGGTESADYALLGRGSLQTIRQKLPAGFQRAEFLLAHGLIDLIVERKDMKSTLSRLFQSYPALSFSQELKTIPCIQY